MNSFMRRRIAHVARHKRRKAARGWHCIRAEVRGFGFGLFAGVNFMLCAGLVIKFFFP